MCDQKVSTPGAIGYGGNQSEHRTTHKEGGANLPPCMQLCFTTPTRIG